MLLLRLRGAQGLELSPARYTASVATMAPMSSVALLIASQFVAAAPELGAQIAGVALPTILVMEVLGAALATVAIYRSGESSRPWKPLSRSNTAGDERES